MLGLPLAPQASQPACLWAPLGPELPGTNKEALFFMVWSAL